MGINVGALFAPIVMEIVKQYAGFHAAFAVAAFGMVISVAVLWIFKNDVESTERSPLRSAEQAADTAATAVDAPPHGVSHQNESDQTAANNARQDRMNAVPDWKRVAALIVIFLIVIVFWMVFHQNGSTLTYWADDNTAWNVSGTISNAINPLWIIILTFPLVWFWGALDKRGLEPATPTKMAFGMMLTGLSFFVLYFAATMGEGRTATPEQLAGGSFRINERVLGNLRADGVPETALQRIATAKNEEGKFVVNDVKFSAKEDETTKQKITGEQHYIDTINSVAPGQGTQYRDAFLQRSYLFQVSPFWLLLAYGILSLGELMLSPMGLSLVSKVAPLRMRGLLMGGWFVATAIGNKLTQIGVYWSIWNQSKFFIVLGAMALVMSVVLFLLLKPLKKAMPGV
jgi:POT family proton-dependent oligopeptide transporter